MLVNSWITVIAFDTDTRRYYIEGEAQVISETNSPDVWLVRFRDSEDLVIRYVDPESQALPRNWVDYLNKYRDKAGDKME